MNSITRFVRRVSERNLAALEKAPPRPVYCTKHIVSTSLTGGPDRLNWEYGWHRTPGNACDGPVHRRQGTLGGIAGTRGR